jgi:hypothetical protein
MSAGYWHNGPDTSQKQDGDVSHLAGSKIRKESVPGKKKNARLFWHFLKIGFLLVLLRIPDFRDWDFRIFKPILKKGFESDPDL